MSSKPVVFEDGGALFFFAFVVAIGCLIGFATNSGAFGFAASLFCLLLMFLISGATQKILMAIKGLKKDSS